MSQSTAKPKLNELILQHMRQPLKLRIALSIIMIVVWYLVFFIPLAERAESTSARITRERKRIDTAKEIESLKDALAPHHDLIWTGAELNELMGHVIDHLRTSPLKLIDLKPEASKDLGPYQTFGLQLALEGEFAEIDAFLNWLESGPRPARVDSIKIDPSQHKSAGLKVQLTLLGLADKIPAIAKAKPATEKAGSAEAKN
jgi:Tfp pilus assembly protein PilO